MNDCINFWNVEYVAQKTFFLNKKLFSAVDKFVKNRKNNLSEMVRFFFNSDRKFWKHNFDGFTLRTLKNIKKK